MTIETLHAEKIDFAAVGEAISHELAGKMVKDYNDANPDQSAVCFTIGKTIIEQILAQPGCVAMQLFNGLNEKGEPTLVYTGLDKTGKIIFEYASVDQNGQLGSAPAIVADRTIGAKIWQ